MATFEAQKPSQSTTASTLSSLVDGDLPLPIPPISPERALQAAAAAAAKSRTNGDNTTTTTTNGKPPTSVFNGISIAEGIVNPYTNWNYLKTLEHGGCLFSFVCRHELLPYEADMVASMINLSAFDNEVTENHVPHVDVTKYTSRKTTVEKKKNNTANGKENNQRDEDGPPKKANPSKAEKEDDPSLALNALSIQESSSVPKVEGGEGTTQEPPYSFLLARAAYLLVGIDAEELLGPDEGPVLLSSLAYQQACQPSGTHIWTDYENMQPHNFRITKPIIPYVYDMTVQFRVSSLSSRRDVLQRLGHHVGTRVDGGLLLERTKRSKLPKEDLTKKAKSVLLYTDLGQTVVLVTHLTVVLQRGLPDPVERLITYLPQKFQAWGLGETCETARNTNRYLQRRRRQQQQEEEASSAIHQDNHCDSFDDEEENENNEFMDAQSSLEEQDVLETTG
jgi:hypothetical protein